VIAEADFVLDLGPEAGSKGGEIVASGTPEQVARSKRSRTAPFLREILSRSIARNILQESLVEN
jgi:excinuclease ABC subunit A